jgi:predicted DNA-binding WGR domain protein
MFEYKDEPNYRDSFYEMKQVSLTEWQARWGRNGSDGIVKMESMNDWDEKIKYLKSKGYHQVGTDYCGEIIEPLEGDEYELD